MKFLLLFPPFQPEREPRRLGLEQEKKSYRLEIHRARSHYVVHIQSLYQEVVKGGMNKTQVKLCVIFISELNNKYRRFPYRERDKLKKKSRIDRSARDPTAEGEKTERKRRRRKRWMGWNSEAVFFALRNRKEERKKEMGRKRGGGGEGGLKQSPPRSPLLLPHYSSSFWFCGGVVKKETEMEKRKKKKSPILVVRKFFFRLS